MQHIPFLQKLGLQREVTSVDFAQANADRDISDDVVESDFVPYACHYNADTLLTKNGELLQIIKITGFNYETSDETKSNLRDALRQAIKTHIDSDRYAIWLHTIRRQADLLPKGEYPDNFSKTVAETWNQEKNWNHRYINELFISIVYEGESAELLKGGKFLRCLIPGQEHRAREAYFQRVHEILDNTCSAIAQDLSEYGARKLRITSEGGAYHSEPLRFLGKIINLQEERYPVPEEDISTLLPKHEISFGFNAMEVRSQSGYRRFGAVLTIKEYKELSPEIIDQFLQIPQEFIVSQCMNFINSKKAVQDYTYQQKIYNVSEDDALAHASGLTDILQSDSGKLVDFGEQQLMIFLINDTYAGLEKGVAKAVHALGNIGMVAFREDLRLAECYWSQLPANFEFISRLKPINTSRIGGFTSLHNFPSGKSGGSSWGPPVTLLHTTAHSPYFFNFHDDDKQHGLVVAGLNARADFLLHFMVAMAQKFSCRTWVLDTEARAAPFISSLNGEYFSDIHALPLNPFAIADSESQQRFATQWLATLFPRGRFNDALPEALLESCVAHLYSLPEAERHLDSAVAFIRPHVSATTVSLLEAQIDGKLWAHDAEKANPFEKKVMGIQADFPESQATADALRLLWMRNIEHALDGSPTLLVIRQAEKWIESGVTGSLMQAWLDRLQAKNAVVLLVVDAIEQVGNEPIYYSDILPRLANRFFLPCPQHFTAYKEIFRLNKTHRRIVKLMQKDRQHYLLLRDKEMIIGELTFPGHYAQLRPFLAPRSDDLARFHRCRKEGGDWQTRYLQEEAFDDAA